MVQLFNPSGNGTSLTSIKIQVVDKDGAALTDLKEVATTPNVIGLCACNLYDNYLDVSIFGCWEYCNGLVPLCTWCNSSGAP